MSSITSTSTLLQVFEANVPKLSDLDHLNCLSNMLHTGVEGLTGCVTLMGVDLTDFNNDCEISANCDPTSFLDYDGYAIAF